MKTNIAKISQEWEAMLQRGTMPAFELELKDGEYLLVDLVFMPTFEEIRFSFDSMNLLSHFSGNIRTIHDCRFALPITEYDDDLDRLLECIYEEINQGFIGANDLYPDSE